MSGIEGKVNFYCAKERTDLERMPLLNDRTSAEAVMHPQQMPSTLYFSAYSIKTIQQLERGHHAVPATFSHRTSGVLNPVVGHQS
ncbi:MAG: hypothetical protein ACR2PT_03415 [Endozoicomonas sp.]